AFGAAGLSEDLSEAIEELVVRGRLERPFVCHGWDISRVFSTAGFFWDRARTCSLGSRANRGKRRRCQGVYWPFNPAVRRRVRALPGRLSDLSRQNPKYIS